MNISPDEAQDELAAIQRMVQKTRRSIASSGAHTSLIVTGAVWLTGFLCTQFLSGELLTYIWIGISILGGALATLLGLHSGKRVRNPATAATARRASLLWLLLFIYTLAAIAIAWPLDGKQLTLLIVLCVLTGWMAMGVLLSFNAFLPGLLIIALALVGYFFLPGIFYLWMAILVGGGMIALGVYIRSRW